MKVIAVIVLVAFAAVAQALNEKERDAVVSWIKVCMPESGVDEELVKKMRTGTFTEDDKLKAYVRCMFGKAGFMDASGALQVDVIKAKIPADANREDALKVLEICKDKKGSDDKETAYLMYKCYRENAVKPIAV